MTAGDKTPDSIASLRQRGRRPKAKPTPPLTRQADLFGAVEAKPAKIGGSSPPLSATLPEAASIQPAPRTKVSSVDQDRRIWSVSSLVGEIRQRLEREHTDLWVEGEISNCRPAPSGHIYFTLKDGEAQLPVVLFRRQAQLLRFRPTDGLAVLVRGRISVYESRGQLQLIAETMEPRGAGALQFAFEQLKARLLAEGLFSDERKRPLPAFPQCIGIVTSPTGAVIRDIVTVVRRRYARLSLLIYPASMQGANCASSVEAGICWFNKHPDRVDLIILARGGGSLEDLSGFNDEALARAIAASELPVVSAIGHETDFTIADFVADLRAPTPSAAAEIVTAAQHRIEERIQSLERRVHRAGRYQLLHARQRYAGLSADSVLVRLRDAVSRRDQRIDELRLRLESAAHRRLRIPAQRLATLATQLDRQNPALRLATARRRLVEAGRALDRLRLTTIATRTTRLDRAAARLNALSPLAVLSRGYALVYAADGTLLREATSTQPGQQIRARLASGSLTATVKEINE